MTFLERILAYVTMKRNYIASNTRQLRSNPTTQQCLIRQG